MSQLIIYQCTLNKPEPNILKTLPIIRIPSSTSQKITHYSYYYLLFLFVLLFCILASRETCT